MTKMEIPIKRGNLKRNQNIILKLKTAVTEMKVSSDGFTGRYERAEERINEFKDKTMEILELEGEK